MKGRESVARRVSLGLAPWIAAIALWYGVRLSGYVNVSLIPAPHQVAAKFVELLLHEGLLYDIYASTRRVFLGVVLGIAAAVPVGFALGWYRPARTFADPMINFFRALPPIALIPLVIVYFGVDEIAKLVILFYAGSLITGLPAALRLGLPQGAVISISGSRGEHGLTPSEVTPLHSATRWGSTT